MSAEILHIHCRIEETFEEYRLARLACDADPSFEKAERARLAWKAFIRAGMSEDERCWLDGGAPKVIAMKGRGR